MTGKVISIKGKTRPEEIRAGIIEALSDWLNKATLGELKALALCAVHTNGSALTLVSANDDMHALLGSVVHLQHDIITSLDD